MKEIALIGPTASGKSDLALRLASENNAYILSLDSLSIYKEINIASAKPSQDELTQVKHFGVDLIYPNEEFSVGIFVKEYLKLKTLCEEEGKNLIIVGGSSFYLRTLVQGLSPIPEYSKDTVQRVKDLLQDLFLAYELLLKQDPEYMKTIESTDRYRIEKMLLIYVQTGLSPSKYFELHPPKPTIKEIDIYEIDVDRSHLKERIKLRTQKMIEMGLIDEVAGLEYKYTRLPNALKAIGIIEVYEYLDGRLSLDEMKEEIILHTGQLAKRQQTFNKGQFPSRKLLSIEEIYHCASNDLKNVYP
ncbi:MAG: tRNA (adenosine(37)-N6)-dimethylallyltransferase MiaA [Arcobacter sp.]|nr:MAG: tRNA (adenosine(37)-N6)-dimethylallyltransferase MiaA [Arcobacter sp.]